MLVEPVPGLSEAGGTGTKAEASASGPSADAAVLALMGSFVFRRRRKQKAGGHVKRCHPHHHHHVDIMAPSALQPSLRDHVGRPRPGTSYVKVLKIVGGYVSRLPMTAQAQKHLRGLASPLFFAFT